MKEVYDISLPLWRLPETTGNVELDVGHLLNFVEELYHPVVEKSFYDQLYFCVALIFVVLILAASVIGHRACTGRAWFAKISRIASGTFYIPNSVMAFLYCESCFIALWIVYSIISAMYFRNKGFQRDYFLWRILVWVPLWEGGWWTGFGIFSAYPDALKPKHSEEKQHRFFITPFLFNTACWLTPIVQLASLLPSAFLAARAYNVTLSNYSEWRTNILQQDPVLMSPQAVDLIRSQVVQFWLEITRCYWYYGIAMTIWTVWAAVCLAVYVPVGSHTLRTIRRQLQQARIKTRNSHHTIEEIRLSESLEPMSVTIQQPPGAVKQSSSTSDRIDSCNSVSLNQPESHPNFSRFFTTYASAVTNMLPRRAPQKPPSMTMEQLRIRNLRKIYRNLSVQYYGISVAIGCFMISAILQAVDGFVSPKQHNVGAPQIISSLLTGWLTVLFGFLTVSCIFWRSFDPSLNVNVEDEQVMPVANRVKLTELKKRALSFAGLRPDVKATVFKSSDSDKERSHSRDSDQAMTDQHRSSFSHGNSSSAGKNNAQNLKAPRPALTSGGSNSLPEYPSLYYVTPFGRVPAAKVGARLPDTKPGLNHSKSLICQKSTITKGRGAMEIGRAQPSCSLLAEHGSIYKPAASSFGQWRQAESSPPQTPPVFSTTKLP